MNPKNINQEVGYFGPHEKIIEVGDENHMLFQESGDVPFWMTPQDSVAKTFSQYDDLQLKDKTKAELLGNIKSAGVDISVVKGNRLYKIQDISHKNTISVTTIKNK